MTLRRSDLLGTGLVITLIALYLSHRAGFVIKDVRAMTSLALMFGGATVAVLLPDDDEAIGWFALAIAVAGIGFGVAALALTGATSEALLAAFIGSVVLIWGLELAEHITFPPPKQ